MAIDAGVDLVVELPFHFATQQAAIFANGAIEILGALNVQSIFFGSENGDAHAFSSAAKLMIEQSIPFKAAMRRFLDDKTHSYATAWNAAIHELAPDLTLDLAQPNNILGFHYALAIAEQGKKNRNRDDGSTKCGLSRRESNASFYRECHSYPNDVACQRLEKSPSIRPPYHIQYFAEIPRNAFLCLLE